MPVPILKDIVRQHAEMAAFLWTVYDRHLLHPDENPEMDDERLARLVERLEAHISGLRIAGDFGLEIARERFAEFSEPGELFVLRMLRPEAAKLRISDLDLTKVRSYISTQLTK